ncbi:gamma carbonic anhydrase family protein [Marinigracilibium pacificum]|uniref:Gamma carbonic anhydrase family protein n=1 Tax=Marinigracilibium pacificum TaxID=2729599 RepID=A0A848IYG2_9BACT|nr:gamma carbonic anhydrase family protein [Marinigracilibium pacificum]NMM49317.1 gamma carbonic anhydrase family protein [Marinigracilibium pacificum]
MGNFLSIQNIQPQVGQQCWFAPNSYVIGDVEMGDQCTVWFNAVVRGDVNSIRIGNKVNIQDQAVIHCTYKKYDVVIGDNVSIGHGAIVHGCHIEDNVLIGMGAIVMDGVRVEEGAVVAAGAVVLAGTIVEKGTIYAGVPAKKVKDGGDNMKELIERTANNYPMYASWFKE